HVPEVSGELHCELIAGGRSNLTYRITSRGGSYVLRRPPTGSLLPRAHDMLREHRILVALHGHGEIPVPRPIAVCDDDAVVGVPFYVMEDVAGTVLRTPGDASGLDDLVRVRLAEGAVDVLATLHALEPEQVGL